MKGAVELPPALTMMIQALMAVLFGFLGLLLAVPVLVAALVMTRRLYAEPLEGRLARSKGEPGSEEPISPGSRRLG